MSIPECLLQRMDELGAVLARRGDAIALIGLGSVGVDLDRLDEHSDMDFFVVVDDGAKQRYLDSIDWLEALAPVRFSFANSVDGRKVLFADGLFAEYAVFTLDELHAGSFPPGRLVWARADAPAGIEDSGKPLDPSPYAYPEYQLNEALTNLYVGLHRDARGERLIATRFIQSYAVERILTYLDLTEPGPAPGPVRHRAWGGAPLRVGRAAARRDGARLRAKPGGGAGDPRVARGARRGRPDAGRRDPPPRRPLARLEERVYVGRELAWCWKRKPCAESG